MAESLEACFEVGKEERDGCICIGANMEIPVQRVCPTCKFVEGNGTGFVKRALVFLVKNTFPVAICI